MKDNFSKQANIYAQFRPDYPVELFEFILNHVKNKHLAWDCATGNGQAAKVLAEHFDKVIGTDISEKQLANAHQAPNIEYIKCPAEETPFEADSFDLITVAQALHWFDFERFYKEVKRVLKKEGVFVTWGYELNTVEPQIDAKMWYLYKPILGNYWDKERGHIEDEYSRIPFPFGQVISKRFEYKTTWTIEHYLGYLRTWSSTQKYINIHQKDPILLVEGDLRALWGEGEREITFPIFLKMGGRNL
jgi:ubiquinone/menaquinone biosynthesis C-methylase UbiE